jgi:serine/threonine-protein kinase
VRVTAAGYQPTADQAVKIVAGDSAVLNLSLSTSSEGTGIRVATKGTGLTLSIDGTEIGPLPQERRDMTPGQHKIRIEGERYKPHEETVTVVPDKMLAIEPRLEVVKGLATIKAGDNAEGARVALASGHERRPIPKLPIKIDISADKAYTIVAEKAGYPDYSQKISFEDGQAEKTYVVQFGGAASTTALAPEEASPARASAPSSRGGARVAAKAAEKPESQASAGKPAAAGGNGTLNINSIPVANILIDGAPKGATPKMGVSVSAGPHVIMFVNTTSGVRQTKSVVVQAGKTSVVTARFE